MKNLVSSNTVRVRIAPSPTGFPHIGTIFQALINYAIAKNSGSKGKFIVRIEDTDQDRFVKGAEDAIFDALDWFGLKPDESPKHGGDYGPYRQSEKLSRYQERALWLVNHGKAYYCFCTQEELVVMRKKQQLEGKSSMYNGTCRDLDPKKTAERANQESYVIRMKIIYGEAILKIHDDIRGDIEFKKELIDDQVILKSDGFPTYHLAVVVDDYDMKITHVVRGEEWISSTPKHVLLYQYFDWNPPSILHTPLLRNPDSSKLSKRHGHASVSWYKEQGFLPEAILNYLASLVYNHPKGEIFSLKDFVESFDRTKIHSVGARFDLTKLEWMNGEYIRKTQYSILKTQIWEYLDKKHPEEIIEKTTPLIRDRIKKLSDYLSLCEFFFNDPEKYEIDLSGKKEMFGNIINALDNLKEWNGTKIGEELQKVAKNLEIKNSVFFMLLRVAVTGKKISPPLNESMAILGKKKVLERLRKAEEI